MILRQDKYDEAHSDRPEQRHSLLRSSLSPSAARFGLVFAPPRLLRSESVHAAICFPFGNEIVSFCAALWVSRATVLDKGSDSDARDAHPSAESTRIDLIH